MFFERLSEEARVGPFLVRQLASRLLPRILEAADAGLNAKVVDLLAHFGARIEQARVAERGGELSHDAAMAVVHDMLSRKVAAAGRSEFGLAEMMRAAAVADYKLARTRPPVAGVTVRYAGAAASPVLVWKSAGLDA